MQDNKRMHSTTTQRENHFEDQVDEDSHHRRLYENKPRQSKLKLGQLMSNMDPNAAGVLWVSLVDLVVKTVLVVQPHLFQSYQLCRVGKNALAAGGDTKRKVQSVCFEILGFDVVVDRTLRPFLLEVISYRVKLSSIKVKRHRQQIQRFIASPILYVNAVRNIDITSVRPSVCPSVCHTLVLLNVLPLEIVLHLALLTSNKVLKRLFMTT